MSWQISTSCQQTPVGCVYMQIEQSCVSNTACLVGCDVNVYVPFIVTPFCLHLTNVATADGIPGYNMDSHVKNEV